MAFLNLSMPKYAVVRNPITRLLSAYIDKVEDFAPKDQRTVKDFKKWVYKEFPKGGRVSRDWMKVNAHWRPQSFFCGFRTYNLDEHFEIFRVEDPEGYVNFIYDHIPAKYLDSGWGKDLTTSFREFVLGPRSRTTGSTNKKLEYFQDLQFFDHVAEELRDDIRLLGYEDEIALMREEIVKLNAAEKSGALED